jgi:hypothetical protein
MDIKGKGKNKGIFLYSWLPSGRYHRALVIWNFFNLKSGKFGPPFFSMKKIHCIGENRIFSGPNFAKI